VIENYFEGHELVFERGRTRPVSTQMRYPFLFLHVTARTFAGYPGSSAVENNIFPQFTRLDNQPLVVSRQGRSEQSQHIADRPSHSTNSFLAESARRSRCRFDARTSSLETASGVYCPPEADLSLVSFSCRFTHSSVLPSGAPTQLSKAYTKIAAGTVEMNAPQFLGWRLLHHHAFAL
jgi:hypothetical protein